MIRALAVCLPPEMLLSALKLLAASPRPARLAPVPSTLAIPLAARALGAELFPELAVDDGVAAKALALLGDDGRHWLADRATVYGVLVRTALLRDAAREFFACHPHAQGVNLGCGLSHPFQWLDTGLNRWCDADLAPVAALRTELDLPRDDRRRDAVVDLTQPDWWDAAGLPATGHGPPVLVMCEGVLMYLEPAQVRAVLSTFAERAPAGSELLLDAMPWLCVGNSAVHARAYPSVHRTGAQFRWGLRRVGELAQMHERLLLRSEHDVMAGYDLAHSVSGPIFRWFSGTPFYAVFRLGLAS